MRLADRLSARFGRREPGSNDSAVPAVPTTEPGDEPCIPCGEGKVVRTFSLNPPAPRQITDDLALWLAPGRLFTAVDGQVILYDPSSGRSQVLNASAATVWASVDDGLTVAQVIDRVQADTGVDRAALAPDVRALLGSLLDLHVVNDLEPRRAGSAPPDRADRWAPAVRRALRGREWPTVIGPRAAAGTAVVVRSDEPSTAAELRARLAPFADLESGTDESGAIEVAVHDAGPGRVDRYRVYVDGRRGWTCEQPERLLALVAAELDQLAATRGPVGHLLLQASAVERDGRVVVIVGPSRRGKTTLAARLIQDGFAYVADDVCAVDPASLQVRTHPKALELDAAACQLLGLAIPDPRAEGSVPLPVAPDRLGSVSAGGRLALLVWLGSDADDDDSSPAVGVVRPSGPVADVLDLVGATYGASFAADGALDEVAALADAVGLIRLDRAPLDRQADQVVAALAAQPPQPNSGTGVA